MESMDFGSNEGSRRKSDKHGRKNAPVPESNMSGRDNLLDLSYMDVDQMSPDHHVSPSKSSTSFENLGRDLCSVLSLKNDSCVSDCKTQFSDEKSGVSLSSVPSQRSSYGIHFNTTWQPANTAALGAVGFEKGKTGYGIPDGEMSFAHFPDPATGSSTRKRQSGGGSSSSRSARATELQNNFTGIPDGESSFAHVLDPARGSSTRKRQPGGSSRSARATELQNNFTGIPDLETSFAHVLDPATGSSTRKRQSGGGSRSARTTELQQQLKCSSEDTYKNHLNIPLKSSEMKPKKKSSCLGFMLRLVIVLVIAVTVYYIVILYTDTERDRCKLSREFNKRVLEMELEANVFGQHLAARIVPDKIEEYFSKFDTSGLAQHMSALSASGDLLKCKPLVLSFDGWTGVGKNYISRFISQTFQHSRIMNYVIPLNFPHRSLEDVYRIQIRQWIIGNFTQCMVNIIVLDEMDKAFSGVVEGLTEAINELTLPCYSTSPIILLMLSNTHANDINRAVLKFLLDSPTNKREQLTHEHFSSILTSDLNVWSSLLVNKQLIDATVPFLPLEREHIIQCIKRDLVSKRFSTDAVTVNKVLQELSFSSFGNIHLSQTGCKRVADKVDLIMFDKHY